MRSYRVPMVPGPVSVPPAVLDAYQVDYGSADLEEEYLALYGQVQESLRRILLSSGKMAIISGEGMAALWGGLKSGIVAGDRVLAVATGLFGYGIGDMARTIGAQVETVGFEFDTVADAGRVEEAIARFRPKMVTMVHIMEGIGPEAAGAGSRPGRELRTPGRPGVPHRPHGQPGQGVAGSPCPGRPGRSDREGLTWR